MQNFVEKQGGKISIVKGELVDNSRGGRKVPYKIYGINDLSLGKRPLIIWSHGLGGGRDGAGFISRFLAEYGYFVMHIQHAGTDTSLWEGKDGHPWDIIRATKITREVTLDRYKDVPFVLDSLSSIEDDHDMLKRQIDYNNIGMSGHSFGALTSQVMAGQLFPNEDNDLVSYKEKRFKAGILYSFSGMNHLSNKSPDKLFGGMEIPLLFMSGTEDDSPISGEDYTHRLPAYNHASSEEKHVLILNDGDHMVFTGSRGKLAHNPKKEHQEEVIKYSSLAFWEAYLKSNTNALEWLSGSGFQSAFGKDVKYSYKDAI